MPHEIRNLNADAPVEQAVLDATTARAGQTPEPVPHDPGPALYLTQTQAEERLQQTLEFPADDDVTLLLQRTGTGATGTTGTAAGGTTTTGTAAGGTTTTGTAAGGTTPTGTAAGGATTTDTAVGATGTTPDATATGTTPGATTTPTTPGTTATPTTTGAAATGTTPGAATTGTETSITMANLNELGIDHVVADLSGIPGADLEHNQGGILMELGLDTTATGQAAAAEMLALLENFDEPVFVPEANVGLQLTQAEREAFDAASTTMQDDIATRLADLGVDFVNVIGTAEPSDTGDAA